MCYPKPGPRCSRHAKDTLLKIRQHKQTLENRVQELNEKIAEERRKPLPEGYKIGLWIDDIDTLNTEISNTKYEHIPHAQKIFDATPAGIRELKQSISHYEMIVSGADSGEVDDTTLKTANREIFKRRVRLTNATTMREKQILLMKLAQQDCLARNGYRLSPNMDPELFRAALTDIGEHNVYAGKTTTVDNTPENVKRQKLLQSRVDKLFNCFDHVPTKAVDRDIIRDYHDFGLTPGFKLVGVGAYRAAFLDEKTGMIVKIPIGSSLNEDAGAAMNNVEQYSYASLDLDNLYSHGVEYVETSFYPSTKHPNAAAVVQPYLDPELYERIGDDEAIELYSQLEEFTALGDFHGGNMMRNKQTGQIVLFDCLQEPWDEEPFFAQ